MNIEKLITEWLAASNAYDTESYLAMYHKDAILDDPSVGRAFAGHAGIREYFENYFIDYKTQTRIIRLEITHNNSAHLEVEFKGEFPGKKIKGTFDLIFKNGKITSAKAELI